MDGKTLNIGLEACPLRKSDINSLNFVVNRFFYEIISDN